MFVCMETTQRWFSITFITVRCTSVKSLNEEKPGAVRLTGRVDSREYYGLYIKYYVDLGSQIIKVMERNDGVHIYDPGEGVTVCIDPADLMSYAPGGEEGQP